MLVPWLIGFDFAAHVGHVAAAHSRDSDHAHGEVCGWEQLEYTVRDDGRPAGLGFWVGLSE
eukprot:2834195-Rhodomonas_salina.4